jgi:hypothetical protein
LCYEIGMATRRKKVGRPPKRAADKQNNRVAVYLVRADFARLKAEADRDGLTLAAVLLRAWQERGH